MRPNMQHERLLAAATAALAATEDRPAKLLTVQQAADISGESKWTWRARCYKGICASVKMSGPKSRLLIPESEVVRLQRQGFRKAVV